MSGREKQRERERPARGKLGSVILVAAAGKHRELMEGTLVPLMEYIFEKYVAKKTVFSSSW